MDIRRNLNPRRGASALFVTLGFASLLLSMPIQPVGAVAPAQTQAQAASLRAAALAAAQSAAGSDAQAAAAPSFAASPDVVEPINTVLGPYYADGCQMYAMFGNYAGVAFGKSEVYNDGSYCGVSDYIVAYSGGSYKYGNVVSAQAGAGWTNPQSTVSGYSVLSEYVTVCNSANQCTQWEFDAV
jgi:hypothetical protein